MKHFLFRLLIVGLAGFVFFLSVGMMGFDAADSAETLTQLPTTPLPLPIATATPRPTATPVTRSPSEPPLPAGSAPASSAPTKPSGLPKMAGDARASQLVRLRLADPPPSFALPRVDADICGLFRPETLFYERDWPAGYKCVYDLDPLPLERDLVWSGIADEECYSARLAQTACQSNAQIEGILEEEKPYAYCGAGYEVNCRRYALDVLTEALGITAPRYPAPATLCSGMTVGGLGYSAEATHDYQITRQCLTTNTGFWRSYSRCDFLGQEILIQDEFCQLLTGCVEPALMEQFGVVGYSAENIPIIDFTTGAQSLKVDLSCSRVARTDSLHHYDNYCRAIDINAHDNYGNLRRESRLTPVTTMPPELVSVMESCGIIWGGRYIGSQSQWLGCDPMEFAYAPTCVDP
jgi:hypothetical protein